MICDYGFVCLLIPSRLAEGTSSESLSSVFKSASICVICG